MLTFVRDPQAARCRSAHGPRVRLGPAGQPLALHTLSSSNGGKLAGPQSSSTMDAYLGSMQAGTATGSTGADGHGAHVAGTAVAAVYPPCDAPPMQGLVLLAAPLCYLYAQPHAVYRLFKAMYCRQVRLPILHAILKPTVLTCKIRRSYVLVLPLVIVIDLSPVQPAKR